MLENGSDLHVNESQKIRHYPLEKNKNKNKNKKAKWRFVYFAQRAPKLRYYGDVIHSFYWKSAVEHDGGV